MSEQLTLPDGRRAQYWQGGDPRGRAFFFLHGCPDTRRAAFTGDTAARRVGVRLIAVNRPGYGTSDPYLPRPVEVETSTVRADPCRAEVGTPAVPAGPRPAEAWAERTGVGHSVVARDLVAVADALEVAEFGLLGMSLGGPYALACAARYGERVRAVVLAAAPGMAPAMDPPWPRDDLSPQQRDFFAALARGTVAENVERMRPDFEQYVAQLDPADEDDEALATRFLAGLPPEDAAQLARQGAKAVADSVREGLAQTDGYLADAAITFRPWDFRLPDVSCQVSLWYGEHDANAPVRNGRWLADRLSDARPTVRPTTHLCTLLDHWEEILTTT
ncbi:alpha/beta fold hydrolase [Kribbella deserti]|uniref:Alpha/beta fold hydrolase n=1 Tax=Kribbella deserti TaxID=1926257 RepID=A0ABV6QRE4_9ACTN